ncbi:ATP12 family chaperone protein [Mesobacterium pallidum]|uniref:ATP12 family chaperone protein n=1 Tax=Mesobacterium pallidum TaxID=2872037 RepID=UPI001EE239EA|nr:ATP12 family protein [Mesobacterium pallidum]
MSEWKRKRFWTAAEVVPEAEGFAVRLDGRPLRTPAKTALTLPSAALAAAIAAEWDAQEGEVDPGTMPCTRTANSALDKVAVQCAEVADMLADYGGTDLLCYRAETPDELVARQAAAWDPLLDWAARALGAPLNVGRGVMHIAQPETSTARLREIVHEHDPFELAALHDLVAMSGSLVLGLAAARDVAPAQEIWDLSRVDEDWQAEQWGIDEEAAETAAYKRGEFLQAKRFLDLVRGKTLPEI